MKIEPHPLNDSWVNMILEQAKEGWRDGHIRVVAKDASDPKAVRSAEVLTQAIRAALKEP